ncbi:MAG TPA: acetyl-CoA carboxylase biotin carboxyl carrier protein [Pyrinomonadaceae bacterium]|nr:acetyl-CoA carboxylase biotin carboxyl carrier protein [Pyrinomonadaceae bacterium]
MSEITASAKAAESDKLATKTKRGAKKDVSDPSFNMEEIRELADLVDEYGLTDFEFENENIRVRLSKTSATHVIQQAAPAQSHQTVPTASKAAESASAAPAAPPEEDLFKITSPIVGTFYRSPGPEKDVYVKEGSVVTPESVVCIVEAMKLMNEIQAETSGEVVKIYVENGQPVEYGQPLFGIRK